MRDSQHERKADGWPRVLEATARRARPTRGVNVLLVALIAIASWLCTPLARGVIAAEPDDILGINDCSVACKIKVRDMKDLGEVEADLFGAKRYEVTAEVLAIIKGSPEQQIKFTYVTPSRFGFPKLTPGQTIIVSLRGERAANELHRVAPAVEEQVAATFGAEPKDRLLAELLATASVKDARVRIAALRLLGALGDPRAAKVVAAAAAEEDANIVREAIIAQYLMKIAPDAKRVMEVYDPRVMDVWYQESGEPQRDAQGEYICREQTIAGQWRQFMERGLPDFDYATYLREGVKHKWVREDDHNLYSFFGVPWKVQRKACVPELVKLLDDPEQKVRWWAVICLGHTVDDQHEGPGWEQYQREEPRYLAQWRTWWTQLGPEYMGPEYMAEKSPTDTSPSPIQE